MAFQCFTPHQFRDPGLQVIEQANGIIDAYIADGYRLTLRQLYYRFVAGGLIPNTTKSYDRLGSIISKARLAGLIDWDAIEDRGRNLVGYRHFDGPSDAIRDAVDCFHIDLWEGQAYRVEVWVEKQALESVIARASLKWDCYHLACKGYMSSSEMHAAAMRFRGYEERGQSPVVIHLGDHDPSGIDMTRDIFERLNEVFGAEVEVDRIALNMAQVRHHRPPPNPAKVTDSRYKVYAARHGKKSWELDALEPATLVRLIEGSIRERIQMKKFKEMRKLEAKFKQQMANIAADIEDRG